MCGVGCYSMIMMKVSTILLVLLDCIVFDDDAGFTHEWNTQQTNIGLLWWQLHHKTNVLDDYLFTLQNYSDMKANNYEVVEAGETIKFRGVVQRSLSQAFFLVFCTALAFLSLGLVLQIQFQDLGTSCLYYASSWLRAIRRFDSRQKSP